jgi:hypothetical protein
MPLISKVHSAAREEEIASEFHDSVEVQQQHKGTESRQEKEKDSGYEDSSDEECLDSDMEGSIMHRPRPKKANKLKAPALPQRSEKRASRILDNMMLELKNLDGSTPKELEKTSVVGEEDPHELYLSSEEDASLSDDYEDSLNELEPVDSNETGERATSSRASSRRSQEDTARVVSFIMVGKPQIVDIFQTSPTATQKRHSLDLEKLSSTLNKKPAQRRPSPLKLYPNSIRRLSVSSMASVTSNSTHYTTTSHSSSQRPAAQGSATQTQASQPAPAHSTSYLPPRKSSRLASLVSNTKNTLQKHAASSSTAQFHTIPPAFLSMDPYASKQAQQGASSSRKSEDIQEREEPKTPTSAAAAAWKKGISRTLSKARKPSIPKINLAYTSGVVTRHSNNSKLNVSSAVDTTTTSNEKFPERKSSQEQQTRETVVRKREGGEIKRLSRRSATMPVEPTTPRGTPITYGEIMKSVIRAPPPPPLASPKDKKIVGAVLGMGLGRRKSLKGR